MSKNTLSILTSSKLSDQASDQKVSKGGQANIADRFVLAPIQLTGQALLDDMAAFAKEINATQESSRKFLIELGVMDEQGNLKNLCS